MSFLKFFLFFFCITTGIFAQSSEKVLALCEHKEKLGKIDSAISILDLGLKIGTPLYQYPLLVKRGYLYMSRHRNADAEADFDKASAIVPDSFQAFAAKGYLFLGAKQFFKSVDNFDKAIARGGKDISIFFCRAHSLWDTKDYKEAMKAIDQVLSKDKFHANANYLKGRILARTEKFVEAMPWYNIALPLVPQSKIAEVYGYRGVAYLGMGQFDKAEEDLLKALAGGMEHDEITFAWTEVDRRKR
jgi:tetratricopeptide (TPR) repeat protein